MNRFAFLLTTTLIATTAVPLVLKAQENTTAPAAIDETDPELAAINARYAADFAEIEKEGKQLAEDAPDPSKVEAMIGAEGEIKWEITTLKFDIPEIVMKTRKFSMHLPQFRMKTTSIKWDNPEIHMEVHKVGEYPCFYDWKWYSCDIKTDVPVITMVPREAKFDVPEVFWDETSFSLDIPEFYSKRVEIKLHLPQFYVKNVKVEMSEHEDKANALSAKANAKAEAQKSEVMAVIGKRIADQRQLVVDKYAGALASVDTAIAQIRAAGADPANVPGDGGTTNLLAMRDQLVAQRDTTLADIDAKIAQSS